MAELMSFWTYSPFFQTIGLKQSGRITSHKVLIALDLITQLLETCLKETFKGTQSLCGDVPISTFLIKRWNQSEMVIGRKWISTLGLLNSIKHYNPGPGTLVHTWSPQHSEHWGKNTWARELKANPSNKNHWGWGKKEDRDKDNGWQVVW